MKLFLTLFTIATLLLGTIQAANTPRSEPQFLRLNLAGTDLRNRYTSVCKYDSKAGYYLIGSGDCDGQFLRLILTPDIKVARGEGYTGKPGDSPIQQVSLPRLRTGTGVNIGDTPALVQQKLGSRPTRQRFHHNSRVRIYWYQTKNAIAIAGIDGKRNYAGRYTFHDERLWEIAYSLASPDGC